MPALIVRPWLVAAWAGGGASAVKPSINNGTTMPRFQFHPLRTDPPKGRLRRKLTTCPSGAQETTTGEHRAGAGWSLSDIGSALSAMCVS